MEKKSQVASLLLTVCFGPLGLLYSSVPAAVFLIILAVVTFPAGAIVMWPISIIVGALAVSSRNGKARARAELDERRHQELLQATRERDR